MVSHVTLYIHDACTHVHTHAETLKRKVKLILTCHAVNMGVIVSSESGRIVCYEYNSSGNQQYNICNLFHQVCSICICVSSHLESLSHAQ